MPMKSMKRGDWTNGEEYVAALDGWRRDCVVSLRKVALGAKGVEEVIKWGHLVYMCDGPAFLIRAEDHRVLFGFWRGKRMRDIEPRLKPGGKYEMATVDLREGDTLSAVVARRLVKKAVELNAEHGNPQDDARR